MERISGFCEERLGLSWGGFWAFVKVAGFPVEDLEDSWGGFGREVSGVVRMLLGFRRESFGFGWEDFGLFWEDSAFGLSQGGFQPCFRGMMDSGRGGFRAFVARVSSFRGEVFGLWWGGLWAFTGNSREKNRALGKRFGL